MLRKLQYFLTVIVVLAGILVTIEPVGAMTHIIVWHRGTGSGMVIDASSAFPDGQTVNVGPGASETFTATADAGSAFTKWDTPWSNSANGFCSGTGNCTITGTGSASVVDNQIEVFAYFEKTYTITTSNNITAGSINPTSATVNSGSTQAFTITPNYGYRRDTVTGCGGTLSGNTYTTGAITADCMVSVGYSYIPYTITINYAGTGSGTVKDSYNNTNFTNGYSVQIPFTSSDTFTATANAGSTFTGWSGGACSGTGTCKVTVSADTTITATFTANAPTTFTVTTSAGTGGTISPAGPVTVNSGTTTAFTVTANSGYSISSVAGCSGHLSGNTYTTGTITSNCKVSATFNTNAPTTKHNLEVVKLGTGVGTVAGSGLSCGNSCIGEFNAGSLATLTASTATDSTFAGWFGGGCSGTGTCTTALDGDTTVLAVFTMPNTLSAAEDNCQATLQPVNTVFSLNTPIIEYTPLGFPPVFLSAVFVYTPTHDNMFWFRLTSAAATDTQAFGNCRHSIISVSGASTLYIFVPRLILGTDSYWLILQYVSGPGADIMFKLVAIGGY